MMRKVVIKLCISISVFIFVFMNYTNEGSSLVSSIRGNSNAGKEIEKGHRVEILSTKSSSLHEQIQATQNVHDTSGGMERENVSLNRNLGGEAVADLFTTPIDQWSLAQWGVLFVLMWLSSYFLRRCPCIWDMIACYCCFELLCDPNPDPVGFVAC